MPSILASRGWAVIINRVDSQQEIVMVALNEELSGIADRPQRYLGSTAGSRGTNPGSPGSMSRNHPRSVPYCSDSYFPGPDFSRHYARNRNYSPSLGRWINQDPAGYINGANTYQFVESDPVNAVDPTGTIAWYYWAAAGGVDILGGGPEDPLADAVHAGILGAGEAAATEDAAQLAAQQAAREAALKAAQTTARMALLAAAAKKKPGARTKGPAREAYPASTGGPQKLPEGIPDSELPELDPRTLRLKGTLPNVDELTLDQARQQLDQVQESINMREWNNGEPLDAVHQQRLEPEQQYMQDLTTRLGE